MKYNINQKVTIIGTNMWKDKKGIIIEIIDENEQLPYLVHLENNQKICFASYEMTTFYYDLEEILS